MSITVTGIDRRTPLPPLARLNAEIGILYTATPEGRPRYPDYEWIREAVRHLPRVAIHVCGSGARTHLRLGALEFIKFAQRIQINGSPDIEEVESACALYPDKTIITQHKSGNEYLLNVNARNHAVLVDASGGKGLLPSQWERPHTEKPVGFAGGLGPDNLDDELPIILAAARDGWWIDMEGQLRVSDWFNTDRAWKAVEKFETALARAKEGK
jgi:phosphoribosylanthranilate isomerase